MKNFKVLILIGALLLGACREKYPKAGGGEITFINEGDGKNILGVPGGSSSVGGDWESSGGDGVLCLLNEKVLMNNQSSLRDSDYLSQKMTLLTTLENFEFFKATGFIVWDDLKGLKDADKIVATVLERIRKYSPVFAQKLDLVLESINVTEFIYKDSYIDNITDSNPKVEIPANCQLIQLANRLSLSAPNYLPQVEVHIDKFYYSMLAPLDQALLIMHEALYLIGKEAGQETSDYIREVNAVIFSNNFKELLGHDYFSHNARSVQTYLSHMFSDYILRFSFEPEYIKEGEYKKIQHKNNFTRSQSMMAINREMVENVNNCRKGLKKFNTCMDKLMMSDELLKIINTDEKSFLYLMQYYFDMHGLLLGSNEHLYYVDHSDPLAQDDEIQMYLGYACGAFEGFTVRNIHEEIKRQDDGLLRLSVDEQISIKKDLNHHIGSIFGNFMVPALRYCKKVRKKMKGYPEEGLKVAK